jgi:hypothetical protein
MYEMCFVSMKIFKKYYSLHLVVCYQKVVRGFYKISLFLTGALQVLGISCSVI